MVTFVKGIVVARVVRVVILLLVIVLFRVVGVVKFELGVDVLGEIKVDRAVVDKVILDRVVFVVEIVVCVVAAVAGVVVVVGLPNRFHLHLMRKKWSQSTSGEKFFAA